MKVQNLGINLDKPTSTYSAGETVTGKVTVTILAEVDIKQIRIKAVGEAKVCWEESSSTTDTQGNSTTTTDTYSNHETYFKSCHVLYGDSSGEGTTPLAPGNHIFLFGVDLPQNIPDTFKHQYGSVQYRLKAVLERPRKSFLKNSKKVVLPLQVESPHHFIQYPSLAVGIRDDFRDQLSFLFFKTAQVLDVSLQTNSNLYTPGETIILGIVLNGDTTSVELSRITMKLEQIIKFRATTGTKTCPKSIHKVQSSGPYPNREKIELQMTIPQSLPPSRLDHCSIIDINYELVVKFCPRSTSNVKRRYPIDIGQRCPPPCDSKVPEPSAPSMEVAFENLSLAPPSSSSQVTNSMMAIHTRPDCSDDPPPSYEECVAGLTQEELLRLKLQESEDVLF